MAENNNSVTKKVKVNIRSLISEADSPELSPEKKGCALSVDCQKEQDNSIDQVVEFSTEGTLKIKGNTVEITYRENEELGMSDIESTLRFKTTNPSLVNLIRRGAAPASLIFDTQINRRNCTYCIGNIPFSFCICTNRVENTFDLNKGKIILDYDIEMHGIKTEHNVFTLEYKE